MKASSKIEWRSRIVKKWKERWGNQGTEMYLWKHDLENNWKSLQVDYAQYRKKKQVWIKKEISRFLLTVQ